MGKRRARPLKRTSKRPTLAHPNMEIKAEVEDLRKEKNVRLDEEPTNTAAADNDDDATKPLNNLIKMAMEMKEQTIKTLTHKLEEERKKNAELEQQLREDETCFVC